MFVIALLACRQPDPPVVQEPPEFLVSDEIPLEGPAVSEAYLMGHLLSPEGVPDPQRDGTVIVTRRAGGGTEISAILSGVVPSSTHELELRDTPCVFGASEPYLIDPASGGISLQLAVDEAGHGQQLVELEHTIRGDALSAVLIETGSDQPQLCADLLPSMARRAYMSGAITPLSSVGVLGEGIGGEVVVRREDSTTEIGFSVTGLDTPSAFRLAVHDRPCGVDDGGEPYRINPLDPQDEGLGVPLFPDGGVDSAEFGISTHPIREDAQSVLIFRDERAVACADLRREDYLGLVMRGTFYNLPAAVDQILSIDGRANLDRRRDGILLIEIHATGLPKDATLPLRVTDAPCGVEEGGQPYLILPGEPEEGNVLDPSVSTGSFGVGTRTRVFELLPRADARSVVIFSPDASQRLACADLR